jgi:hypothetical protein
MFGSWFPFIYCILTNLIQSKTKNEKILETESKGLVLTQIISTIWREILLSVWLPVRNKGNKKTSLKGCSLHSELFAFFQDLNMDRDWGQEKGERKINWKYDLNLLENLNMDVFDCYA